MDLTRPFTIDPEVSFQKVEGATVIVHLGTGRIHHTNATGCRIWELVEEGRSPEDMLRLLEAEFDSPPGRLRRELTTFLSQLRSESILHQAGE
jgi:hypothetical protein